MHVQGERYLSGRRVVWRARSAADQGRPAARTEPRSPEPPSWEVSCHGGGDGGGSESGRPPAPAGRGWDAGRPSACPRGPRRPGGGS